MGVCVFCVCLETFSRPQQRRDITLEYLLHLGRGRSGANLTSRIAAHRWTHTHTHPIGKEERTHTEALAKTLNLFFFCRGGPGCCGASGTGAVVHPHRWKSRLGLTGLQHGPAHTRLARCARAQAPLSFKVTATATARGHLCRFDKANVRDGHIFGN